MIAAVSLAAIALATAGHPVQVTVTQETMVGHAILGQPHIWIGQQAARDARHGGAIGLLTFLHELGHTLGYGATPETHYQADCYALAHFKPVLRRFWHLRPREIQQRYRDALWYVQHSATPGQCP